MTKHVILDTDIGGDPDDALALLLGVNSHEIVVDLVVTSNEQDGCRAAFARELLKGIGKEVPIVKGSDLGNRGLCHVCHLVEQSSEHGDYLSKIREVVLQNPETYYVCIGPQTNLASFLAYAPDLADRIEAVIMGGALDYSKQIKADYNVRSDITSALAVLESDVRKRYVIRDITRNKAIEIGAGHRLYERIASSDPPIRTLLLENFKNYFEKSHPSTFMHDPLTLCSVIRPELLAFEQKRIVIDGEGKMKVFGLGKQTFVSVSADYKAFMEFLSKRLP